jgi:RNA polymerase sigma-70 factor, ECF subfamily
LSLVRVCPAPPRGTLRVVPNLSPLKLRLVPGGAHVGGRRVKARTALVAAWDDNELVAAVRAGDEDAAGAFHDRLRPRVELTIRRLIGRADVDTEDLGQLAMIALIEGIDRYRGECSLDAWASTVAAHVVYKHIRRRKLERRVFSPTAESEPSSHLNPARALIARDLVRRARELLGSLSEEKAWTFVLHDVCGFDLREIAEITGVTAAAAQGRLVRGRRELHERAASDPELWTALQELEDGG